MFNLSYTQPAEIKGTIKVSKLIYGLGPITDINGKRWDIHGHFGTWVQAVSMNELHPYYSDTSGSSYGMVSQCWQPYALEVVKGEKT